MSACHCCRVHLGKNSTIALARDAHGNDVLLCKRCMPLTETERRTRATLAHRDTTRRTRR